MAQHLEGLAPGRVAVAHISVEKFPDTHDDDFQSFNFQKLYENGCKDVYYYFVKNVRMDLYATLQFWVKTRTNAHSRLMNKIIFVLCLSAFYI